MHVSIKIDSFELNTTYAEFATERVEDSTSVGSIFDLICFDVAFHMCQI